MFIDFTQIDISAGNGGSGAVSFEEKNSYLKVVLMEAMVVEVAM